LAIGNHYSPEAAVFRAWAHLARRDFAAALALLRQTTAANPGAVWPRVQNQYLPVVIMCADNDQFMMLSLRRHFEARVPGFS
jgi:hypothetical protein